MSKCDYNNSSTKTLREFLKSVLDEEPSEGLIKAIESMENKVQMMKELKK